jgi:phosphopantothenate synthetase
MSRNATACNILIVDNNIEYAKSIIRTGSAMKDYLERKKDTLPILISAVNRKCHDDLETLTKTKITA